jgi:NADH dehydrogenase/NADH:ubiquinone oxidoreductase subunit G
MIAFIINGKEVQGREGQTVLDVAKSHGIDIPTLFSDPPLDPYLACRLCVVEVDDGRRSKVVISGLYPVRAGIKVSTDTPRVNRVRRWAMQIRRLSLGV